MVNSQQSTVNGELGAQEPSFSIYLARAPRVRLLLNVGSTLGVSFVVKTEVLGIRHEEAPLCYGKP